MSARFDLSLLPPTPDLTFEQVLWAAGVSLVGGIDEAGRGPLAGPVAAAGGILPAQMGLIEPLKGVRGSKHMRPPQRQASRLCIETVALAWAVGLAEEAEIDVLGIVPATRLAAHRALQALPAQPEHLLLDYLFLPDADMPQTSLIKGDCRSLSIAAASVLAKTTRDAYMIALDTELPGYDFARHKGYGTLAHRQAIMCLGPSPHHRRSFRYAGFKH